MLKEQVAHLLSTYESSKDNSAHLIVAAFSKRQPGWLKELNIVVAEAFGCSLNLVYGEKNSYTYFIGSQNNVGLAGKVFDLAFAHIMKESKSTLFSHRNEKRKELVSQVRSMICDITEESTV